jgi:predicted CXXCH cytochrome family protein
VVARTEIETFRETTPNPKHVYRLPPPGGEAQYVGSQRCRTCHAREYAKWLTSNHTRSVTLPSAKTIRADLEVDGTYTHEGRDYTMFEKEGAYFLKEVGPEGRTEVNRIDYVTGFRRIQMFLTRLPDGRIQSLPIFREVDQPKHPDRVQRERGGRWFDYSEMVWRKNKTFFGREDANHWSHQGRNWNERCTDCHISRVRRGFDGASNTYDTGWLELTVGCEACHGPGSVHVERWTNMEGIPVGRDFVDLRGLSTRKSVEACAECHAEKDEIFGTGFLPGGNFFDYFLPRLIDDELRVYPDGRYKELNYNYMPLAQSRCYTEGGLSCVYCHDPHGSDHPVDLRHPRRDDRFCTDCHPRIRDNLKAHTFHDPRSEGSRCLSCHCPWLTIENGHGVILDHSISIPSPRNTIRHGIPNACTDCHAREGPQWALGWMRQWYGDRRYRIEEIADIVAAARKGSDDALPDLVRMLEDPAENLIYRATAAKYLARYPKPRAREALMRGLGDKETLVRVCSILGLLGHDPKGVRPTLRAAMARDASLAVRKTAAMYLVSKGDPESMPRARAEIMGLEQITPNITRIYTFAGHSHYVQGDLTKADLWYRKVLEIFPWDRGAFDMLARMAASEAAALYGEKKYALALKAIAALDAYPLVSPGAELWRGYCLMAEGEVEAAAAAFERGAGARGEDYNLLWGWAQTLGRLQKWEELTRVLDRCLAERPASREARLWRARIHLAAGERKKAEKDVMALLAAHPKDPQGEALLKQIRSEEK